MKLALLLCFLGVVSGGMFNLFPSPSMRSETLTDPLPDYHPLRSAKDYEVHGISFIESYAGFFTTDKSTGKNMFWWYFPSQDHNTSAPLLIWLQGGPGGSSLFGLFAEMGPFELSPQLEVSLRETSWNKKYQMLFIDNPVGAGFSYTTMDSGYCTDTKLCVASNLYSLLQQFYTVFPALVSNPLYITGESYGGHYVPAISYYIHQNNQNLTEDQIRIPLEGLAIGDGWVDPVEMIPAYPDLMFNTGMADENQRKHYSELCDSEVELINNGDYEGSFRVWDMMLNGDLFPYGNYFHNTTGSNNYDNYLRDEPPVSFSYYAQYVNQDSVRKAIHVGSAVFNNGTECEKHLTGDFMRSFKQELGVLMDNYKVLVYSGQLDVIIGAALTERFLPTVEWSGQEEYSKAERLVWRISPSDKMVAGYVRVVGNFQQVLVRGAGHILPYDQPERGLDMIQRFVEGIPYESYPNPVQSRAPVAAHKHEKPNSLALEPQQH